MLELLSDPSTWVAFGTLTVLEIVLGIDNIVFISVLVSGLPKAMADRARQLGLLLALAFRILLLLVLTWIIGLTQPVISGFGIDLSWKDIILLAGGAFLLYKATSEMHKAVEGEDEGAKARPAASFFATIVQIVLIDMVFSIDSIVTAIGLAQHVEVMIAAVIVAVGIMYAASGSVAGFIARHPTTKMLALAFLLLIGVTLVADGLGFHIDKGYVYGAMAFATAVEAVNILSRRNAKAKAAAASPESVAIVAAGSAMVAKPKRKTTAATRSQSRPKSAPRKAKT
jgi:predicted tellurium resistance membrane protein TerC